MLSWRPAPPELKRARLALDRVQTLKPPVQQPHSQRQQERRQHPLDGIAEVLINGAAMLGNERILPGLLLVPRLHSDQFLHTVSVELNAQHGRREPSTIDPTQTALKSRHFRSSGAARAGSAKRAFINAC
jgi:hypothetical protein